MLAQEREQDAQEREHDAPRRDQDARSEELNANRPSLDDAFELNQMFDEDDEMIEQY